MTPLKLSDIRCPSFYKSLLHRFLLGILDRCNYIRVGNDRVSITSEIRRNILEKVKDYGTGRQRKAFNETPNMSRNLFEYGVKVKVNTVLSFFDWIDFRSD